VLSVEEEAVIVAFRRYTLLPLDDCLYALQPTIPHLSRSSLHRCLQRHGIGRLPDVEGDKPARKKFKDATVKRFYYESHHQLRQHLADFVSAYNFGRRLKALKGLTPFEYICKIWTKEPERFRLDPTHQTIGPNILAPNGSPAPTPTSPSTSTPRSPLSPPASLPIPSSRQPSEAATEPDGAQLGPAGEPSQQVYSPDLLIVLERRAEFGPSEITL
jgi:hypothetical protein